MEFNHRMKQGLFFGIIAGIVLAIGTYGLTGHPGCFLLIPVTAVMGLAPQMLRPPQND